MNYNIKPICIVSTPEMLIYEQPIIPSANEANCKTKENIENCCTQQLYKISKKISEAIVNGKFSTNGDGYLETETEQRLKELGYKVDTGVQYNQAYWVINWR